MSNQDAVVNTALITLTNRVNSLSLTVSGMAESFKPAFEEMIRNVNHCMERQNNLAKQINDLDKRFAQFIMDLRPMVHEAVEGLEKRKSTPYTMETDTGED